MKPREFNGEYQLRSAFEEFNESKMCGNIKRKREIRLSQSRKKVLAWKYSNWFWYFDHIFLLQHWIYLILAATERGREDIKLCSLPEL